MMCVIQNNVYSLVFVYNIRYLFIKSQLLIASSLPYPYFFGGGGPAYYSDYLESVLKTSHLRKKNVPLWLWILFFVFFPCSSIILALYILRLCS